MRPSVKQLRGGAETRIRFLSSQSKVLAIREEKADRRCDIVIYSQKYIFGLCPISGIELLKPLEFPKTNYIWFSVITS